eukprot:CCRYP_002374-RA/>CCRYP_002374-RA protein AED:0.46 eAED:0.71 QI:0/0/0/1/0/0/2/135/103
MTKAKGGDQKCKMELMDSASPRSPRKWAGLTSTVCYARSMGGRTKVTTPVTAAVITKTVLRSRRMGVQIVRAELKKALRKKSGKLKKRHANDSESDRDSDKSS